MISHPRPNSPRPDLSIIVPTLHEAANLRRLVEQVFAALAHEPYPAEMIVVDDDSRDGTTELVLALSDRYPVRLVVRTGERDLSTAVLRGFAEARGELLAVMDADLSHPPASLLALVDPVRAGRCDLAIGSRRVPGAAVAKWPWYRHLASWVAAALARGLTAVRDPTSGFFCLRREVWANASRIDPLGYKIGLELLVRARPARVLEVPIRFTDRAAGRSKMSLQTQWQYLKHLMRLYQSRLRPHPRSGGTLPWKKNGWTCPHLAVRRLVIDGEQCAIGAVRASAESRCLMGCDRTVSGNDATTGK